MLQTQCRIGMRINFGRPNGEKTLGEVIKMNPAKAKVRILESRGSRSEIGAVWGVPYSMMTPADDQGSTPPQSKGIVTRVSIVVTCRRSCDFNPIPRPQSMIAEDIQRMTTAGDLMAKAGFEVNDEMIPNWQYEFFGKWDVLATAAIAGLILLGYNVSVEKLDD